MFKNETGTTDLRRAIPIAMATLALWVGGAARSALAADDPYREIDFISLTSGKALEVDGNGIWNNGTRIQQWSYWAGTNQNWEWNGDWNRAQFKNRITGKCLELSGPLLQTGMRAQQRDCDATRPFQLWSLTGSYDGMQIKNTGIPLCLDVYGFSNSDGAAVVGWPCNGQSNQKWRMEPSDQQLLKDCALGGGGHTRCSFEQQGPTIAVATLYDAPRRAGYNCSAGKGWFYEGYSHSESTTNGFSISVEVEAGLSKTLSATTGFTYTFSKTTSVTDSTTLRPELEPWSLLFVSSGSARFETPGRFKVNYDFPFYGHYEWHVSGPRTTLGNIDFHVESRPITNEEFANGICPQNIAAAVYTEGSHGGAVTYLKPGRHSAPEFANDAISSLILYDNWKITLYEHEFSGREQTFTSTVNTWVGEYINDKTSSLLIWK
jgi:hypothetical protein